MSISDSERILQNGLDGTPHVDDLISAGQQGFGLVREVVGDARLRRTIALIDVNTVHWATKVDCGGRPSLVLGSSANGVVED